MITSEQVGQAINTLKIIADTIKDLGSVPSGHLYAQVMGHMDIQTYDKIVGLLVRGTIVRKQGDLLIWNVQ